MLLSLQSVVCSFEADVRAISSGTTSLEDLDKYRDRMKKLADHNAHELKKNVYSNYKYYIDTSKEIANIRARDVAAAVILY